MAFAHVNVGVQTGSGKTFTTFGPGAVMENHLNLTDPKSYALRGLVPRVLEYLYASIARQVDNGGGKVRQTGGQAEKQRQQSTRMMVRRAHERQGDKEIRSVNQERPARLW